MSQPFSSPKKYESPKECCHRNGISVPTLYRLLGAGQITAVKFGHKTLVEVASADRYFSSLPPAKIITR